MKYNLCWYSAPSLLVGPWEIWMKFYMSNFQGNFIDLWPRYLFWYCPQINVIRPCQLWVNIGSGNGLVPSSNKPLPEPILSQCSLFMKIIGHIGHFRWTGPNVWWEISLIRTYEAHWTNVSWSIIVYRLHWFLSQSYVTVTIWHH